MQACLKGQVLLSALLSATAVLFRQTNAVWAVFILGVSLCLSLLHLSSP